MQLPEVQNRHDAGRLKLFSFFFFLFFLFDREPGENERDPFFKSFLEPIAEEVGSKNFKFSFRDAYDQKYCFCPKK